MDFGRLEYEKRVNRVIDHIRDHLADELSLESLAAIAAFSPFHFHRIFRAMTGETLAAFVQRLRLERAAVTLIHRFLSNPTSTADGWENHRDIRMRTFLALMEDLVTGASLHDPVWNAVVQDAVVRKHYSNDQALVAQTLLNEIGRAHV